VNEERRPDPDKLLEAIRAEHKEPGRGRLKIFFGYVAGVGKTYAMLEAAQQQAAAGVDVVAGYVEPHARPETMALLEGLELLPPIIVDYRGVEAREFDLDAALARRPELILVDELAHSNAPGLRHAKRWQDVEELLLAGINVHTTLNVQHIESLNDIVAQITGVRVRETVPDSIFDEADSVELVDLPPQELVDRLQEGKVYVPAQAQKAMESFFKRPNLGALREIALRRTADRVHEHVETARVATADMRTWATMETLMVCIGPSPTSGKVIRTAKRMAAALNAHWIAASVETSRTQRMSDTQRGQLMQNVRLAEHLGAETVTIAGEDVADEIVSYAKSRNATKIVIGKTGEPRWKQVLGGTVVDKVLRGSSDVDVYVIQGLGEAEQTVAPQPRRRERTWNLYLKALALVLLGGGVSALFQDWGLAEANKAMVFLLVVALVAVRWGRGPGILASVVSVLAFDFFFVPPYFTFAVSDAQYVISFAVLLVIAVLLSTMAGRVRSQVQLLRSREQRAETLYRLNRELAGISGSHQLALAAERQLTGALGTEVLVYLVHSGNKLEPVLPTQDAPAPDSRERAVAQWTFDNAHRAGSGTDTLPDAGYLYLPMATPQGVLGVLGVRPPAPDVLLSPEYRQLLETVATQVGLAIERDQLAEQTQRAIVQAEAERLRSSLLSSVSHDLRTPLAVIAGTSSALRELGASATSAQSREMLGEIYDESNRMARLVDNLLSMTRLDSGTVTVNKQWIPLEDLVGSALGRLRKELAGRVVNARLPADLPLVPMDGPLVEQALVNLLENANRYATAGTPLDICARVAPGQIVDEVVVEVADRGPGLDDGEITQVFDRLYRGSAAAGSAERGVGLGLSIARAIIQAHGGNIQAANRAGGGAVFSFGLPLEGAPPELEPEV
jgi:two-component system, OmpR family, sensor histidine kinase KdpD